MIKFLPPINLNFLIGFEVGLGDEKMNKWVSLKTAAEYLDVSKSWLYQKGEKAGVPRVKIGRTFRYNLSDLDDWMNGRIQSE